MASPVCVSVSKSPLSIRQQLDWVLGSPHPYSLDPVGKDSVSGEGHIHEFMKGHGFRGPHSAQHIQSFAGTLIILNHSHGHPGHGACGHHSRGEEPENPPLLVGEHTVGLPDLLFTRHDLSASSLGHGTVTHPDFSWGPCLRPCDPGTLGLPGTAHHPAGLHSCRHAVTTLQL